MAVVVKKINQVTYIVHSDQWRSKEKIVHVDKLKLKTRVGGKIPTPSSRRAAMAGDPYSLEVEKKRQDYI